MKNIQLTLAALAIAGWATGCKQSNSADVNTVSDTNVTPALDGIKEGATNAWQKTKEATTNAFANTKEATAQTWADVKDSLGSAADYSYDKKDAFVASAQADLKTLDQKIQDLSDKAAAANDSVKTNAQIKLQELRDKRAALDKKLDDVKNAAQDGWNDAKTAFKNAYDDLKDSIKQAWQWLKDKLSS
jgi:hypothetical protein